MNFSAMISKAIDLTAFLKEPIRSQVFKEIIRAQARKGLIEFAINTVEYIDRDDEGLKISALIEIAAICREKGIDKESRMKVIEKALEKVEIVIGNEEKGAAISSIMEELRK